MVLFNQDAVVDACEDSHSCRHVHLTPQLDLVSSSIISIVLLVRTENDAEYVPIESVNRLPSTAVPNDPPRQYVI